VEDPRPDLVEDSKQWEQLLGLCLALEDRAEARRLYGSLHGFRCCGARLISSTSGLLEIAPGTEVAPDRFTQLEEHYFQGYRESLNRLLLLLSS
jgi:hypothetical protein